MTTQMVFNIDKNLKKKAMTKAKKLGVPFSFVLNKATEGFVEGEWKIIPAREKFNAKTAREIRQILREIKENKGLSPAFKNVDDLINHLERS